MKIKAIRLAEVGPFSEGVALEGLSGRLDVLAGPNELGKSTLFRALALLLAEKHTSTARSIQALRPNSGGAPLVEAEMEIEGCNWRLTKRFLTQRSAELADIESGRVWRGSDAEEKAAQLLHTDGRDRLRGFVWVGQTESFALPKSDAGLDAALAGLIEHEASAAAGAGRTRRVRAAIDVELEKLVTLKTGKPKAGGPLAKALEERDEISRRLDAARARAATAARRIEDLTRLRSELESTASTASIAAVESERDAARKALAEVQSARERKGTADAQVAAAEIGRKAAADSLARHDGALAALEKARAEQERLTAELESLGPRLAATEVAVEEARLHQDGIAGELAKARSQLAKRVEAERQAVALREAQQLEGRIVAARGAAESIARLDALLAKEFVTADSLRRARALSAEVDLLNGRIAASAPRVSIEYLPDAAGRVRVADKALVHGESIVVEGRLKLVIDGVGTLLVALPAADGVDVPAARDDARKRLDQLLTGMGVRDLAEAEARLVARVSTERERSEAAAQLAAQAPRGIEEIERALQPLRAKAAVEVADDLPAQSEIEAQIATLEHRLAEASASTTRASDQVRSLASTKTRLDAELSGNARRMAELSEQLPASDILETARQRLVAALDAADSAFGAAVRESSAWAQAVPVAEAFDLLKAQAATLEARARTLVSRRGEIERAVAEHQGALRRDGEDGTGAEISFLEEQLDAVQARVSDLQLDIQALNLLVAKLDAARDTQRDHVLRPVVERLRPMLHELHPGSNVALEGPLLVARLERDVGSHAVQQLSDGTREQIAVLVRLAYAGLMSERGQGAPLVLDDALAFSDDQRFATMIRLLAHAADRHQIIMLSCRESALASLGESVGANLLKLGPWTPREDVRAQRQTKEPTRRAGSL